MINNLFFTIGYSKTDDVIFELIRQDNTTATNKTTRSKYRK